MSTTAETTHSCIDTSSATKIWCVVGYPKSALAFPPMVLKSTVSGGAASHVESNLKLLGNKPQGTFLLWN